MGNMGKVSLSVTIDSEIEKILGDWGKVGSKSIIINDILRRTFRTEIGIKEEIKHHKDEITKLEIELESLQGRNKERIENIPDKLKGRLGDIKRILENHPDKVYIWTKIINKEYTTNLSPKELLRIIERWT